MTSPTADVSVRVAWADDAEGIAAVQVRAWRTAYDGLLPADVLASLDPAEIAAAWHASLSTQGRAEPGAGRPRAQHHPRLRAHLPASDPDTDPINDGEVSDLTVDPAQTGQGHGSRLMQACADTLRADRFTRGLLWVAATDDALRRFATGRAGPDGAHRELDLHGDGAVTVKQVRLHTDLSE